MGNNTKKSLTGLAIIGTVTGTLTALVHIGKLTLLYLPTNSMKNISGPIEALIFQMLIGLSALLLVVATVGVVFSIKDVTLEIFKDIHDFIWEE